MGGAVSSGENNDELVDNLLEADYIKSPLVEKIFRAVDRAFYYTKGNRQNPYKDLAWKDGNLHLSAPCIYSEVLENLNLEPGLSFLNIGSGTGYLSSMAGLILGRGGINHGIELHADVVEYARYKLGRFKKSSHSVDLFEFCEPSFVVGNCMDALPVPLRYDRIYCGAACPPDFLQVIIDTLKIGGILVVPINDSLVQMTRVSETEVDKKTLLSVSFAPLIETNKKAQNQVQLPEWNPLTLKDMCRAVIRAAIRANCVGTITELDQKKMREKVAKDKMKSKSRNRNGQQSTCVIGRLNGQANRERGILSIAYALRNRAEQDSDDDSLYHPHDDEDSSMNLGTDSNDEDFGRPLRSRSKSASSSSSMGSKESGKNSKEATTEATETADHLPACSSSVQDSGSDVKNNIPGDDHAKATTDSENKATNNDNFASSNVKDDQNDNTREIFKSPSSPPSRPVSLPSGAHASSRVHFLRQAESMEVGESASADVRFRDEVSRRLRASKPKASSQSPTTETSSAFETASQSKSDNDPSLGPNDSSDIEKMEEVGSDSRRPSQIEESNVNPNITQSARRESTSDGEHPADEHSVEMDEHDDEHQDPPPADEGNRRPHHPRHRRHAASPEVERMAFLNVPVDMSDDDAEETNSESEGEANRNEGDRRRPRHRRSRDGQPLVAVVQLGPRGSQSPTPPTDLSGEYVDEPLREITHPLTVQMTQKIETLLLPPTVKMYLNYNRNL